MITGRGATTCLICDKQGLLVLNNVATVLGIKLLFETKQFNILLMSAMICVKCTGRLHQLFDFNILKLHIETTNDDDKMNDPDVCSFCGTSGIMKKDQKLEAASVVAKTKWRPPSVGLQEGVKCCFSCYNFLSYYIKIEKILTEQNVEFRRKLNHWTVQLEVLSNIEVISLSDTSSIYLEDAAIDTLQPNDSEAKPIEDETNAQQVKPSQRGRKRKSDTSTKTIKSDKSSESSSCESVKETPKGKRKTGRTHSETLIQVDLEKFPQKYRQHKSESFKLVDIKKITEDNIEEDKFSLIKMRRASSRPSTPFRYSKKRSYKADSSSDEMKLPKSENEQNDEQSPNEKVSNSLKVSSEPDESLITKSEEKYSDSFKEWIKETVASNSLIVSSENDEPKKSENGQNDEQSPNQIVSNSLLISPENDETETDKNEEKCSDTSKELEKNEFTSLDEVEEISSVILSSHNNEILNVLTEINESQPQEKNVQEIIESTNEILTVEDNLMKEEDWKSLFPNIEEVIHEEVVDDSMNPVVSQSTKLFQDYSKLYDLKDFSIQLIRLGQQHLQEILGDRIRACPKVTKSGRVTKPKIIPNSSLPLKKDLKTKIQKKEKTKNQKKENPKITYRNFLKSRKSSKSPIVEDTDDLIVYEEEEALPYADDIEEDYVEYESIDGVDMQVVEEKPIENKTISVEFIAVDSNDSITQEEDEMPFQNIYDPKVTTPTRTQVSNAIELIPNIEIKCIERQERTIEMEFLSPRQQHKGKITFQNHIFNVKPTKIFRMREVC